MTRKKSFRQEVIDLLSDTQRALTLDEMAKRLLPDTDRKTAHNKLRTAVGTDNEKVIRVDTSTYDLVDRRLIDSRFRYRPTCTELQEGMLFVAQDLGFLFAPFRQDKTRFKDKNFIFTEPGGRSVEIEPAEITAAAPPHVELTSSIKTSKMRLFRGLNEFFNKEKLSIKDELILQVRSIDPPHYSITIDRASERDAEAIRKADEKVIETCHQLLKYSGEASPQGLMRRLVGVWDFSSGDIPHLPMFLLPRDSRFLYYFSSYYLLNHPRTYIPYYEKGIEISEMEKILQRNEQQIESGEQYTEVLQQMIQDIFPGPMPEMLTEIISSMMDEIKKQRPDLIAAATQKANKLRRLSLERMRILRGLWPGEPDPKTVQQWVARIDRLRSS